MEFWGVEVPSGKPVKCVPGDESYIHVSQAALGENKSGKGNDRVVLKVKVDDQELVIGTLSQSKVDQTSLDLIFDREFSVSHNGASSVYLCGYKTDAVNPDDDEGFDSEEDFSEDESDEEEAPELVQVAAKENGKPVKATKEDVKLVKKTEKSKDKAKPEEAKDKAKQKGGKPIKAPPKPEESDGEESSDEDDVEDDSEGDEEEDDSDEEMLESSSDDEDLESDDDDEEDDDSDDEDDSEEEEEEPKAGKKRPHSGSQNVPEKKSKVETPSGGVKAGKKEPKTPSTPSATPKNQQSSKKDKKTPAKEAATPASGKKSNFSCNSCKKNFNTESGLTQHNTAKHNK